MPGLKRHLDIGHEEEGEDEVLDDESAQSKLRQDTVRSEYPP